MIWYWRSPDLNQCPGLQNHHLLCKSGDPSLPLQSLELLLVLQWKTSFTVLKYNQIIALGLICTTIFPIMISSVFLQQFWWRSKCAEEALSSSYKNCGWELHKILAAGWRTQYCLSCKAYVPLLSSHSHHPVFLWSNCICSTCREWQILVPATILYSLPVSDTFVVAFGQCSPQPLCIKNNYLAIIA